MSSGSSSIKIVRKMMDSMELLWDTNITMWNKNPKGIIEGKCPNFSFNHIAHSPMGSGIMYFISHRCFLIFELVEVIKGAFNPATKIARDLQGKNILSLDPKSVARAFSPPTPMFSPIPVDWYMVPSSNVRANIMVWLNKKVSGTINFMEFPSFEVPIFNFSTHLQLLLSMLAITAGERLDRYVSPSKLAIAYQIFHPNSPTMYDWAIAIFDGMLKLLEKIDEGSQFAYASYIIWMMIHQNVGVFKNLNLAQID